MFEARQKKTVTSGSTDFVVSFSEALMLIDLSVNVYRQVPRAMILCDITTDRSHDNPLVSGGNQTNPTRPCFLRTIYGNHMVR